MRYTLSDAEMEKLQAESFSRKEEIQPGDLFVFHRYYDRSLKEYLIRSCDEFKPGSQFIEGFGLPSFALKSEKFFPMQADRITEGHNWYGQFFDLRMSIPGKTEKEKYIINGIDAMQMVRFEDFEKQYPGEARRLAKRYKLAR